MILIERQTVQPTHCGLEMRAKTIENTGMDGIIQYILLIHTLLVMTLHYLFKHIMILNHYPEVHMPTMEEMSKSLLMMV